MFGFFSFYSILLLALTLLYIPIIYMPRNEKYLRGVFWGEALLLLLLATCRGENVGGDLESYIPVFYNSESYNSFLGLVQYSVLSGYELGFVLICKTINFFDSTARSFIVITSILSFIGPFYIIYKLSSNKIFSLYFFFLSGFYNIFFNSVRQALAISVVMFSIILLIKNKRFFFFVCVIIASLIHSSAIFSLLFYPISKLKYSFRKTIILIMVFISIFILFGNLILKLLIANVFSKYLDNESDAIVSGTGYGLLAVRVFVLFFCLLVFNSVKRKMDIDSFRINRMLLYSLVIAVLCQLYASLFANLTRLSYYFYLPIAILIPNIFDKIKDTHTRRFLYFGTFVFFYVLMCLTFLSPVKGMDINVTGTIPYIFLDGIFSW